MEWICGIPGSTCGAYISLVEHLLDFYSLRSLTRNDLLQCHQVVLRQDCENPGRFQVKDGRIIVYMDQTVRRGRLFIHMLTFKNNYVTSHMVKFLQVLVDTEEHVTVMTHDWSSPTPLHYLLQHNRGEICDAVKVLLKRKPSQHVSDWTDILRNGWYPIHFACGIQVADNPKHFTQRSLTLQDITVLQMLLDSGAGVNVVGGPQNLSPLTCVLTSPTEEGGLVIKALKLLLGSKACVKRQSFKGFYPIHLACGAGLDGLPGSTKLHHVLILEHLLEEGCDVNAVNVFNMSALHQVVLGDGQSLQMIDVLLQNKADLNVKDHEGMTPLHYAVSKEKWCKSQRREVIPQIVNLLLKGGATVNILDNMYRSPLHYAVTCGIPKVVEQLLVKGADPFLLDIEGCQVLDLAEKDSRSAAILEMHCSQLQNSQSSDDSEVMRLRCESDPQVLMEQRHFFHACRLVSVSVGHQWKLLIRSLEPHDNPGETEGLLDQLEEQHRGQTQEALYQALRTWRVCRGTTDATIARLTRGLRSCHLVAVAEEVEQEFKESSGTSCGPSA